MTISLISAAAILAGALNFSSGIKFGARTVGKFQFIYGEGIQNYLNDAPTDIGIKNNFGDTGEASQRRCFAGAGHHRLYRSQLEYTFEHCSRIFVYGHRQFRWSGQRTRTVRVITR